MHADECQPAPGAQLSRRTLFGAVTAFAAVAPALAGEPAAGLAADFYRQYRTASDAFAVSSGTAEEEDAAWTRVSALRTATLDAAVLSPVDAVAQVRLAAESIRDGLLPSGMDLEALERVARWLEAR